MWANRLWETQSFFKSSPRAGRCREGMSGDLFGHAGLDIPETEAGMDMYAAAAFAPHGMPSVQPFPAPVAAYAPASDAPDASQRVKDVKKPFSCQFCPATFTRRADVTRHERSHSGVKPFVCEYCPSAFAERTVLVSHMRIHTGDKPFECQTCGKRFTQRSALVRHERVHSGDRPFEYVQRSLFNVVIQAVNAVLAGLMWCCCGSAAFLGTPSLPCRWCGSVAAELTLSACFRITPLNMGMMFV